MEIELKYKINDPSDIDRIWNDEELLKICDLNSREALEMHAVYFDTEDHILESNRIILRLRQEGNRYLATVKGGGSIENGLHRRMEYNVDLTRSMYEKGPDPTVFKDTEIGKDLVEMVRSKVMKPQMAMHFTRKKMMVKEDHFICEAAIDLGEIVCCGRKEAICELELELLEGDLSELNKIGGYLSKKYGLTPENTSKYARGLKLG